MMLIINLFVGFSSSIYCRDARPHQMVCEAKSCNLDEKVDLKCVVFHSTKCIGERDFLKENVSCRYCFQLNSSYVKCKKQNYCEPGIEQCLSKCYANDFCMGPSWFSKKISCTKNSLSHTKALIISLFLGGLGFDRFYLGYFVIGIFKLLTFGGFGTLYLIDIILIGFGFLGPADGSLFIERVS